MILDVHLPAQSSPPTETHTHTHSSHPSAMQTGALHYNDADKLGRRQGSSPVEGRLLLILCLPGVTDWGKESDTQAYLRYPSGGHEHFVLKLASSGTRSYPELSVGKTDTVGICTFPFCFSSPSHCCSSWALFGHKWAPLRPTTP
jgi:hypothetical protein